MGGVEGRVGVGIVEVGNVIFCAFDGTRVCVDVKLSFANDIFPSLLSSIDHLHIRNGQTPLNQA